MFGQNGHLPLSPKLSSKMPIFWNYLVKCPCFKLDFLKIEFQLSIKNSIFRKSSYVKSNLKKKKMELEFHVKFLTFLDFHQIEFQNRDILLDSFKIRAFCYIFWAKWASAHFGPHTHTHSSTRQNLSLFCPIFETGTIH